MKKLLAFTLCFIMVLSCSIPAFAAELPYNESTGQSTVTYQVDSSFCVIIPETVDVQLTAKARDAGDDAHGVVADDGNECFHNSYPFFVM